MSHATDIVGYIYKADIYCPGCILGELGAGVYGGTTEQSLSRLADERGIDRFDEYSFDSDEFPKVVFRSQIEDEERCGACGEEI